MTVWDMYGAMICRRLMSLCMNLGLTNLSQNILNFAEIHFLKIPPTHFCRYKLIIENGKMICFRCSKCGQEKSI